MIGRDLNSTIKKERNTRPAFQSELSKYRPDFDEMVRLVDRATAEAPAALMRANAEEETGREAARTGGAARAERKEGFRAQDEAIAQGGAIDMDFDYDGYAHDGGVHANGNTSNDDDEFSCSDSDDDREHAANSNGGDALNINKRFSEFMLVGVSEVWSSEVPDTKCSLCVSRRIPHSNAVSRGYIAVACECVSTL